MREAEDAGLGREKKLWRAAMVWEEKNREQISREEERKERSVLEHLGAVRVLESIARVNERLAENVK